MNHLGVIFANPELSSSSSDGNNIFFNGPVDYNAELLSPDKESAALLSFYAPWPMLKSSGIESRDLSSPESAFVQVAPIPLDSIEKYKESIPKSFFISTIFGQQGKYGAYGAPTDIKISKLKAKSDSSSSSQKDSSGGTTIYQATFTTLTPAMRESERKVYISTSIVGNGVFMLVTGTTSARFKSQEALMSKVAESFLCVSAPTSSLRR